MASRTLLRRALLAICAVAVSLAASELAVRALGLADYPIYRLDAGAGYIPAQGSGAFFHRARWAFNAEGMGTEKAYRVGGIPLVGDSVVFGGVDIDQESRVAARLEAAIHQDVWPITAQGWSLINELGYLESHPALTASARCAVFVTNSGDFVDQAKPDGITLPTHHHVWELLYMAERGPLRRYLAHKASSAEADWRRPLKALPASPRFLLYSQRDEPDSVMLKRRDEIKAVRPDARFASVRLPASGYKRDGLHPTEDGAAALAAALAPLVAGC